MIHLQCGRPSTAPARARLLRAGDCLQRLRQPPLAGQLRHRQGGQLALLHARRSRYVRPCAALLQRLRDLRLRDVVQEGLRRRLPPLPHVEAGKPFQAACHTRRSGRYQRQARRTQAQQVEQFRLRERCEPVQPSALGLRKPLEPHSAAGLQVGPCSAGGQFVSGAQQLMPRRARRDLQCRPRLQTEALEDLQRQRVRQRHKRRMRVPRQHGLERHGPMRGEATQQRLAERRALFGRLGGCRREACRLRGILPRTPAAPLGLRRAPILGADQATDDLGAPVAAHRDDHACVCLVLVPMYSALI
eukprot:Opistho-1_new@6961